MSDDRFKQARRSLIDRHNQRQQDNFGDDFEDEATAMVDLDAVERQGGFPPPPGYQDQPAQSGSFPPPPGYQQQPPSASFPPPPGNPGQSQEAPNFGPPPNFGGAPQIDDNATELFSLNEYGNPPEQQNYGGQQGGVQMGSQAPASSSAQVVIGDEVGYEGSTQFINIAELAAGGQSVAPDEEATGYDGNTQFVDLNALQAQGPHSDTSIEGDSLLRQSYQFGAESIQHGEFTLIFAQNATGQQVILKRIWEGDPTTMPYELRQRLAALDPIRHPRLVSLNGVLSTQSGAWVEMPRPGGQRLTDVIAMSGVQSPDSIRLWMQQIGEILTVVHQFQFVYANLTTDAVWIQQDGSIMLEPFDILTFENRGNLGAFGPPELSQPPEHRIVSPSTDVYSMAAVVVAASTGLPLNLQAAQAMDPSLGGPSMAAFNQNPAERPLTPIDFAQQLGGGVSKKAGGKPKLNMKIIIGVVAVLGFVLVGALYMKQQSDAAAAAAALRAEQELAAATDTEDPPKESGDAVGEKPDGEKPDGEKADGEKADGENADADKPASDVSVEADERLTIAVDFSSNPAVDSEAKSSLSEDEKVELRNEANEALKSIDRLTRKAQNERYTIALKKMAELQRGSGGKLEPEDQEFLADLLAKSNVKKIRKENLDQVNEALKANKLTSAKLFYQQVESVDGAANAREFFGRNKSARIEKLQRAGAPAKDEEAKDGDE